MRRQPLRIFAQRLAKDLGYSDSRAMLRGMPVSALRDWMGLNRIDWEDHMKDELNKRVSSGH